MEYSAERSIWPSFHAGFRWEISSQSQVQSGFGSNHSDDVVILMTLSHPFFPVKMIMILTQGWYPLVNIQKTMENHHSYSWENPLFRMGHFQVRKV